MNLKSLAATISAFPIVALAASSGQTQTFTETDLHCEDLDGTQIIIDADPWATATVAYLPDFANHRITFVPSAANERPEPVVKLDFARACLSLIEREDDICSSVRFLSVRDALTMDDLQQFETYYIDLAEREPENADEAYANLKEIFTCF